jgi:hypothetical protein
MSRELPSSMTTAVTAPLMRVAAFAEFEFASGTLRMWSGYADIVWNSVTWTGGGDMVGISEIDETTEIGAAGMTFELNGADTALVALALTDAYQGRPCRLWIAEMAADFASVTSAYQLFGGRMDVMRPLVGPEETSISLAAESRLIDLLRPRTLRYTNAEQQRLYPGDRALEYVAKIAEKPLYWGVPPTGAAAPHYAAPPGVSDGIVMEDVI